jgi:hypothetical protein
LYRNLQLVLSVDTLFFAIAYSIFLHSRIKIAQESELWNFYIRDFISSLPESNYPSLRFRFLFIVLGGKCIAAVATLEMEMAVAVATAVHQDAFDVRRKSLGDPQIAAGIHLVHL